MAEKKKSDRPTGNAYTCSTTDVQKFIDTGAPLDEGRPRRGMPDYNSNGPKPNENDSSPETTS